jgi:hypothetical protein
MHLINVFLRSFNPSIVGRTGQPVAPGRERDGYWWEKFEVLLKESLAELGHDVFEQKESPIINDQREGGEFCIYVHKTKRDLPEGDLFYMQMHLRELFVLDHMGWGADHSSCINPDQLAEVDSSLARQFVEKLRRQLLASGESKHPQVVSWWHQFQRVPRRYILAPLQIPRDYVIKHHSPVTVYEYIEQVADWANQERIDVVFKLHPHNKRDRSLKSLVRRKSWFSRYVHCVDGNIQKMISDSSGLVLINSGTGFEALIQGKPVATFGQCDYKVATYSVDKAGLGGLRSYFERYDDAQKLHGEKLVYAYCHNFGYYLDEKNWVGLKRRVKAYLQSRLAKY